MNLDIKILDPRIGELFPAPAYGTEGSAGMDLIACLDAPTEIVPGQVLIISSGIAIHINDSGYMALLAPRSGLGIKHRLILANSIGVIDSDYQDEVKMALWNAGSKSYTVEPGERVCQLIITPVQKVSLSPVESFSHETDRGLGGLGHTGRF